MQPVLNLGFYDLALKRELYSVEAESKQFTYTQGLR